MEKAKKTTRNVPSMEDEDRLFFESAYKNNPKARAAMDAAGVKIPKKQLTGKEKVAAQVAAEKKAAGKKPAAKKAAAKKK
jgi:hypothetical protein